MMTVNQKNIKPGQQYDFLRIQDLLYLCLARWTVSYTHLDVYKRQLKSLQDIKSAQSPITSGNKRNMEQTNLLFNFQFFSISILLYAGLLYTAERMRLYEEEEHRQEEFSAMR